MAGRREGDIIHAIDTYSHIIIMYTLVFLEALDCLKKVYVNQAETNKVRREWEELYVTMMADLVSDLAAY